MTFPFGTVAPPADSLPAFVDAKTANRAGSSSAMSVAALTGVADGDKLYAWVFHVSSGAAAATISGFTQIAHDNGSAPSITVLKKTAASESGGYSVASSNSGQASVIIAAYRGGAATEDVVGTAARDTDSSMEAASITATVQGVLLVAFNGSTDGRTISTPPSGMTQRAFQNDQGSSALYELSPSAAGATGTKTAVFSGSQPWVALQMQIK